MQTNELGNKMPHKIIDWFINRGITRNVLSKNYVHWDGRNIVIPIYDASGKHLFNKYRRDPYIDPDKTTLPKYRYDKGSGSAIYGLQHGLKSPVFITEGELDALRLQAEGLCAVSSTGGSGTFQPEWAKQLENLDIIIVYDRDQSGFKGAARVQSILPHARVVTLPPMENGCKDITDYLLSHTMHEFLDISAEQFNIPLELEESIDKTALKRKAKAYQEAADEMLKRKQEYMRSKKDATHIIWMLDYLKQRYEQYNRMVKTKRRLGVSTGNQNRIQRAREIPISEYIQFNRAGYSKCLWHTEKSASMFYNKPESQYSNTVKCFGCGAMGDVIDVVMQLYNKDFNGAVKIILHED